MVKLGFIGLGIMGRPMAIHLLRHGYTVTGYDVKSEAVEQVVAKGGKRAHCPKEVAENSTIIFIMVPDSTHVEDVIFNDENGIVRGATAGTTIVDMSSITPEASTHIAKRLAEKGIHMLDAPVSGGESGAVDASLAFMVGGQEEVFLKIKPILQCMGKSIIHVGPNGAGVTCKLANQIIVNVNIATMAEAFVFAQKAGIEVEKMYKAIRSGLAGSNVLDMKGPMVLDRNFEPGGPIYINAKDIQNVLTTAKMIDMSLPLTSEVARMFQKLVANDKVHLDHCSLVQVYEDKENVIVGERHGSEEVK